MLTYELNNNGYVILRDGAVLITQEFIPGVPGIVEFPSDESKQLCAEATIVELTPPAVAVEG